MVTMKMALKSCNCDKYQDTGYTFILCPLLHFHSFLFCLYAVVCRKHNKNSVQYLCLFNARLVCDKYVHILGEQNNADNIWSTYFMAGTDVRILFALINSQQSCEGYIIDLHLRTMDPKETRT